ncbi:hypothetical protein AB0C70_40190 [Streptomyces sp. NPDC048564]|uniref:hypothetical protein n=1 Tax=Streptomyces sp. NPDC048564 TaxID=3155760 RepID=UPI0034249346
MGIARGIAGASVILQCSDATSWRHRFEDAVMLVPLTENAALGAQWTRTDFTRGVSRAPEVFRALATRRGRTSRPQCTSLNRTSDWLEE